MSPEGLAQRILTGLGEPIRTHGHVIEACASIGVAVREPGEDAQDLLRHADIAMYAAKKRGKGTFARYTPDLSGLLMTPESRLADLRRAVAGAQVPAVIEVGRAALVSPGFAAEFAAVLHEAATDAAAFTVALPAAQMADDDAVRRSLGELRAIGVRIALDQTGTGTVRLDLLEALPFTTVFVDPPDVLNGPFAAAVSAYARDAGIECRVRSVPSVLESAL